MTHQTPNESTLGFRKIFAFALPAMGFGYLLFFVQFYFLKFGVDVLLLSPVLVGGLMAAAKIWDAVTDPFVGSWSDRTESSLGRRTYWMWLSLPVFGLGFVAIWLVGVEWSQLMKVVTVFIALLVFYTGFTMYTVPHTALGAELSSNSHQRTRAFATRHIFWTIGLFLAFAAIQIVSESSDSSSFVLVFAVFSGLAALAICMTTPVFIRERSIPKKGGGQNFKSAFKDVLQNRAARVLCVVWFIENLGSGILGAIAPFYAVYVLDRPDLIGTLPAVFAVCGVLSIPIWVKASAVFGKKATWIVAMLLGAAGFIGTFLAIDSIPMMFVALGMAGAGLGCGGALAFAVLADVIDADERRTGERKEGVYTAALNFSLKMGIAMATILAGVMLSAVGYVANEIQSPESIFSIRVFFAALPSAGFILGAILFSRFDVN